MTQRLRRCPTCKEYTLRDACPRDGARTVSAKPAKYSPEDPYGEYRRRLKRLQPPPAGPDAPRKA